MRSISTVASAILVASVLAALVGCSKSGEGDSSGGGKTSTFRVTRTARPASASTGTSVPTASATATGAATAAAASTASADAPSGSLADLFKGDVPAGGTARPIFRSGAGSGVIVLVPAAFAAGSGVYGDGYMTTSPDSAVGFSLEQLPGIDPKIPKLSDSELKQLCYPNKIDKFAWEAPVDVTFGPDSTPAIAWKGKGVHLGDNKPWGVYAISTVMLKNKRVRGCGGWNLEKPEAEQGIIQVLKSLRTGVAANTDPGMP